MLLALYQGGNAYSLSKSCYGDKHRGGTRAQVVVETHLPVAVETHVAAERLALKHRLASVGGGK